MACVENQIFAMANQQIVNSLSVPTHFVRSVREQSVNPAKATKLRVGGPPPPTRHRLTVTATPVGSSGFQTLVFGRMTLVS